MPENWNELVRTAEVIDGHGIRGITVRQVAGIDIDDVILCPAGDAEQRVTSLAGGRSPRRLQPERIFLARTLRNDAETAAALLVKAVLGRWAHARGRQALEDVNERRTWEALQVHLANRGHKSDGNVAAGVQQIAERHISPPAAHKDPADVIRKAIAQMVKQIDGRHVIVMGSSPLAV